MRTLYFNAAPLTDPDPDASWDNLAHWSDEHGQPAQALPENGDAVVICSRLYGAPSSPVTLSSIVVTNPAPVPNQDGNAVNFSGAIGDAVFGPGTYNEGTVSGNAEFTAAVGGAFAFNGGTITGKAVFDQGASNSGTVNGDAVFHDGANYATVIGNAAFAGAGGLNRGTVNGNATFAEGAHNGAEFVGMDPTVQGSASFAAGCVNFSTVVGLAIFDDDSRNVGNVNDALFKGGALNAGQVQETGTFTETSSNSGNVSVAIFKDHSSNTGTFGQAMAYFPVARPLAASGGGQMTWIGYYNYTRKRRSEMIKESITELSWPINVTDGIAGDRMELWLTAQGDRSVTFDPSIKIPQGLVLPVLPDGETYVIGLTHDGRSWVLASLGGYGVKAALAAG